MRYRNLVLFLALAVAWGSAFTAIKAGLEFFPPVLFAAFRYDAAGVLMLAYAVYATDQWRPVSRQEWYLVGVGGLLLIAAYHAFLFVGEQGTTSAAAAIIVSLSPVLTTGFARGLLPDERLTALGIAGLLLGFAGVVVLSNPDPSNLVTRSTVSQLLVFLAAASFALGSVLTRRIDADLPIETMEAWSMLLGAVLMHVVSRLLGESVAGVEWTADAVLALAYLVVVASALGFLVYFDLLERLGPIEINFVSYAAPVVAAVTGFLVLQETPSVFTVAGFTLIVIGFALLKRDALRDEVRSIRRSIGTRD
ncbi:Permease of the drug/metabolite transporter (DMT) superfamily [Halomicrobium zhouii]|uniref:Permease of the drug/metabolite transporter (DMT) superfamily n=1 Tax=Halomicrobium zhouii TaxID=767519 RepID=A0A1I6LUN1_9EURY|nr:EamA family transporter [Halomicrobium zhouii]SFS07149.1 Permease of the drug/metabolite transporter (DMT) superfamily [Halomicrobium zhouii]